MKAECLEASVERNGVRAREVDLLVGRFADPEQETELEETVARIHQELAGSARVEFRVIVEGTPVRLRPKAQREVRRVCYEALKNAYRHSCAQTVEVEIAYRANGFRVVVRDNGVGIDSQASKCLDSRRGLRKMKQQAEGLGGRLRVLSQAGAGTEIEMSLGAQVAFAQEPRKWTAIWLNRFHVERVERAARIST